jgi:hypothetical protein
MTASSPVSSPFALSRRSRNRPRTAESAAKRDTTQLLPRTRCSLRGGLE